METTILDLDERKTDSQHSADANARRRQSSIKPNISIEKLCETLMAVNGAVTLAAKKLNITPSAIYNRAANHPIIKETIKNAREEMIDYAEQKLRLAVLNGEPWAIAMVLKTIGKNRGYIERVENTGLDGGAMEIKTTLYLPKNDRDNVNVIEAEEPKLLEAELLDGD